VDEKDVGYKLQIGYMVNRNFGVEGGWVDLGKFRYNASFTGGSAQADIKASGINIAGIGVLPLDHGFSLFGKLGVINAKVKTNVSASGPGGSASANESSTNWSPNYGLGVMYDVSPKFAIRAEWERFDKVGDKNKTGEGDVDLLSVGLRFSF
jgi:OOP family OmpA-OmpF porin